MYRYVFIKSLFEFLLFIYVYKKKIVFFVLWGIMIKYCLILLKLIIFIEYILYI